ncbi:MAG: pitrilysin family protein [Alphaproteobacteria bacterium]|nr:pitrilysin family protein [Alphaproteobacteria bacterium]
MTSFEEAEMHQSLRAAAVAVTALVASGSAAPAAARVFDPTSFTLANGLTVVVIQNSRAPVVQHMVWYKVGSADEPLGKSGIAHYLEHLMFKGSEQVAPGEFSRSVARHGGRDNAFTSFDYTAYFQTIAADRLEMVMRMEADRMANLRLTDSLARPELGVVLEERRQRVDSQPGAQLSEQVQATLYQHHPYRIPIIGWEHEIRSLTADDALAFYRTWYAPNNAVLVVSGAVTPAGVRDLAERIYGPIPARTVPARQRVQEPPRLASARVEMAHPRVRQVSLALRWLTPIDRPGTEGAGTSEALQVLEDILGGGATSRLHRALVLDQQLATGASASYDGSRLDQGQFALSLTPKQEVAVERAEAALRAELARLLADGVSEAEVQRAQHRLLSQAIYARDSLGTGARAIGLALATGGTIEDVEHWPDRIRAVTAAQVSAIARAVLRPDIAVVSVLRPQPQS